MRSWRLRGELVVAGRLSAVVAVHGCMTARSFVPGGSGKVSAGAAGIEWAVSPIPSVPLRGLLWWKVLKLSSMNRREVKFQI